MITQEQAQFYKDQGYLVLKGLINPQMLERMRKEADGALARMQAHQKSTNRLWKGDWLDEKEREKQVIDAIHDVQIHAAVFHELLCYAPLLDALELMIGPNVQLHHTKLLAKPPQKGGAFPMHQDYPYFPHEKHTMMAVSVYLDDATVENGCIRVVPGSHKLGPLPCDPGGFYLPPAEYPIEEALPAEAKAGDAVAFNYLTIHGSAPNRSDRPRRNVLLEVRDPSDRALNAFHRSRGQGTMLRGINPHPELALWEEETEKKVAEAVKM